MPRSSPGHGEGGGGPLPQFLPEVPLSFPQQLLRFFDLLRPGSTRGESFNVAAIVRLEGALDEAALAWAAEELVRRHDVLRTVLHFGPGVPRQVVTDAEPAELACLDLTDLAASDRAAAVDTFYRQVVHTRFDVGRPPLARVWLGRMRPDDNLLGIVVHHSAGDDLSLALLLKDLGAVYESRRTGSAPPARPQQYAAYSWWQEQRGEATMAASLDYWERQLENLPSTSLSRDRERPAAPSGDRRECRIELDEDVTERFVARARRERATPFMLFLHGYMAVLRELTGADELVVPVLTSGREAIEFADVVGYFLGALLIRVRFQPDDAVPAAIERVRGACLDAYRYQRAPIVRVLERADDAALMLADPDYTLIPLQILELHRPDIDAFAELRCTRIPAPRTGVLEGESALPLDGLVTAEWQDDGRFVVKLVYDTDLFEHETVAGLARRLELGLRQLAGCERADTPAGGLSAWN